MPEAEWLEGTISRATFDVERPSLCRYSTSLPKRHECPSQRLKDGVNGSPLAQGISSWGTRPSGSVKMKRPNVAWHMPPANCSIVQLFLKFGSCQDSMTERQRASFPLVAQHAPSLRYDSTVPWSIPRFRTILKDMNFSNIPAMQCTFHPMHSPKLLAFQRPLPPLPRPSNLQIHSPARFIKSRPFPFVEKRPSFYYNLPNAQRR